MLDAKNPLGLPLKAPPLEMILQFNNQFAAELHCRYGYVHKIQVDQYQNYSPA